MTVKIVPNDKGNPPGKLADAELHFLSGPLEGLKLIGFAVWERKTGNGRNVTFPSRQFSVNGEMGVYPDHDALLALLRAGSCSVTDSSGVHRFVVGRGFVDIGPARVTILTDSCVKVSEVDKAKAGKDLAEAEHELATADAQSERYRQAQIAYERSHDD